VKPIRLTINGENEFIITVEDDRAEIRAVGQPHSKRHRHMDALLEGQGARGKDGLTVSLAVEIEP
jgi:hypothetical protein